MSVLIKQGTTGNDNLSISDKDSRSYSYQLYGRDGNDVLAGGQNDDYLSGGTGVDTLIGGAGNDTYSVDSSLDVIIENASEGTDLVISSVSYILPANVENISLTGKNPLGAAGNASDNLLKGNSGSNWLDSKEGNDTLDGGAGSDMLIGGAGNDTYIVDDSADVAIENANEGIDQINSSVTYTLPINVENLSLTGTDSINATGNASNNTLTGNSGNNILDGGAGIDTLIGGAGNDTYTVDDTSDVVTENADEGTDQINSSVTYTLPINVENLSLTGTDSINATGNASNNTLTGNSGNNVLDGGVGVDTLIGGAGDDTYTVDSASDIVTENANEGTDQINSSASYILSANVENLSLTGTDSINATGNASNNTLTGNSGNNVLDGGAGIDTLIGGAGDDTYTVDNASDVVTENANEGTDQINSSVTYTLPGNVENLSLTGTDSINATGNASNNTLTGNSGNNVLDGGAGADNLDGGTGIDTLIGGAGDDAYTVDTASDVITENADEGTDQVKSSVTYTLPINVENLILTGTDSINATGNASNNTLTGNGGNNVLDGGAGTDTLIGGAGDDTYAVDNTSDVITENANEGTDQINSSVSYVLPINVENLSLTGTDAVNATGNASNNTLTGNSGDNVLDGGVGVDTLIGGAGNDTYTVDNTADVITENANEGIDWVNISVGYTLPANVENVYVGGNKSNIKCKGNELDNLFKTANAGSNITLVGGAGNDIYSIDDRVAAVIEDANGGIDTIYGFGPSFATRTLPANVENLTLMNSGDNSAQGNALDNVLTGNPGKNQLSGLNGADTLDGGAGVDTLIGGAGDDTYMVDTASDVITENANGGIDQINSSVTYTLPINVENLILTGTDSINATGNASNNTLTGNGGNNVLDGGAGIDALIGGAGDDTYTVDNASDVITENANEGTDQINSSVTYTLPINVENLSLTGTNAINATGNASDNTLIGNSGNNVLDGGVGVDSLIGGAGDDTYTVDNASDVITENANEGTDQINSNLSYTLPLNVENLSLTGTDSINATGNASNNTLTGNSGNNVLDGGTGIDTLIGGAGDDTYTVGNASDVITENANEGVDQINSSASYILSANVENLSLIGTDSINATGNASNNTLTGNSGNNVLDGGAGIDTLIGGTGDDTYTVDNASDVVTENADEGTDQVNSSVTYTLPINVENLSLTGTDSINATGNAANNILTGNSGNNVLDGGAGIDTLIGGAGDDTYTVGNASDVITENANEGTDQINSNLSYTLPLNVENLSLTGTDSINATGNASNNTLTGNSGNNVLDGDAGIDTLIGGAGDDTYTVDNASDVITENANEGTDQINSSVTYTLPTNVENLSLTGTDSINATGNASNNTLTGNGGNNVLNGGAGIDTLIGGAGIDTLIGGTGDDIYTVDNASDVITENANEGNDQINSSVSYVLPTNVENLSLTGTDSITATGNALNNLLIGNSAANSLTGGGGTDTLKGGLGDDAYVIDGADLISEDVNGGMDTVYSSISYTLPDNVERLTLGGKVSNIKGVGNSLDNVFNIGSAGSNLTLVGGAGNDGYYIDDRVTSLIEDANGGIDTIYGFGPSFATHTLPANVENLTLMNSGDNSAQGNALGNVLTGNPGKNQLSGLNGADTLDGAAGIDTLIGGDGKDQFNFSNIDQRDTIQDFSVLDDTIGLSSNVFTKITSWSSDNFVNGTVAKDSNDYIIYDKATGILSYDADGNGATVAIQIALIGNKVALDATDFILV